jgi:hypothetical protein
MLELPPVVAASRRRIRVVGSIRPLERDFPRYDGICHSFVPGLRADFGLQLQAIVFKHN